MGLKVVASCFQAGTSFSLHQTLLPDRQACLTDRQTDIRHYFTTRRCSSLIWFIHRILLGWSDRAQYCSEDYLDKDFGSLPPIVCLFPASHRQTFYCRAFPVAGAWCMYGTIYLLTLPPHRCCFRRNKCTLVDVTLTSTKKSTYFVCLTPVFHFNCAYDDDDNDACANYLYVVVPIPAWRRGVVVSALSSINVVNRH